MITATTVATNKRRRLSQNVRTQETRASRSSEVKDYGPLLKDWITMEMTRSEINAAETVAMARPTPLRDFDQISMHGGDLLRQVKLIAPYLEGKDIVFMGDNDSTSLMLGMLGLCGSARPNHMLVLDFDERLLTNMQDLAKKHGFSYLLEVRLYNAFDTLPNDLVNQYDWFYTNPPFGSQNQGLSPQLFITRGCELVKEGGSGCIILPYDQQRAWTREAMLATQRFLTLHGWVVKEELGQLHQYHLDDDQELLSSMLMVDEVTARSPALTMPWAGRCLEHVEIPSFYGRSVAAPYPHYINKDRTPNFDWSHR